MYYRGETSNTNTEPVNLRFWTLLIRYEARQSGWCLKFCNGIVKSLFEASGFWLICDRLVFACIRKQFLHSSPPSRF